MSQASDRAAAMEEAAQLCDVLAKQSLEAAERYLLASGNPEDREALTHLGAAARRRVIALAAKLCAERIREQGPVSHRGTGLAEAERLAAAYHDWLIQQVTPGEAIDRAYELASAIGLLRAAFPAEAGTPTEGGTTT